MSPPSSPSAAPCAATHLSAANASSSWVGKIASGIGVYSTNTTAYPVATTRSRVSRWWLSKSPAIHTPPCRNRITGTGRPWV